MAEGDLPFRLSLFEGIALVVVANQTSVDKPREIKSLGTEHRRHFRHVGGGSFRIAIWRKIVQCLRAAQLAKRHDCLNGFSVLSRFPTPTRPGVI